MAHPFHFFAYFCEMKNEIRHRRLYAFYNSKVLNALTVVGVVALLQIGLLRDLLLPVVCGGTAFALFLGYSIWFWIKKPARVVINPWMSDISIWFTLYFLVVAALRAESSWWYLFPVVAAVMMLFIELVKPHDEEFAI